MPKKEDIRENNKKSLKKLFKDSSGKARAPKYRKVVKEKNKKDIVDYQKDILKRKKAEREESEKKRLIWMLIFTIIAIFLILMFYLYLLLFHSSLRKLSLGKNIDYAYVKDDVIYVKLLPVDYSTINNTHFFLTDSNGNEYFYSADTKGLKHKIYPSDVSLESLDNVSGISADFEFFPYEPVIRPSPNETNQSFSGGGSGGGGGGGGGGGVVCRDTCKSLGYECGNFTICGSLTACGNCSSPEICRNGKCLLNCTNECESQGIFCDFNTLYNCTLGSEGCFKRTNLTECQSGQQCFNGTCIPVSDCSDDSDCSNLSSICSYGTCNSTGKCEIKYNSSSVCRPAAGECDLDEMCTGNSPSCPADAFKEDGDVCSLGICSSGKCVECIADSGCPSDGCYSGEYRDYYCNSSSCVYDNLTAEESDSQGNCGDSIDNDCDGLTDSEDTGCTVCVPDTCPELGYECGIWDDGCGGSLDCGNCQQGYECQQGACVLLNNCGNNVVDSGEVCDGIDLGGETCQSQGYAGGDLSCLSDCSGYDTSGCDEMDIININSCRTLNGANTVYRLTGDVSTSMMGSRCFTINAENVTLECQNNRIRGSIFVDELVYVSASNAAVKNCRLSGASGIGASGIRIGSGSNSDIRDNTITGCDIGVYISSGSSVNNSITGNSITDGDPGIRIGNSAGNIINSNIVCSWYSFATDIQCSRSQAPSSGNTCDRISRSCGFSCDSSCGAYSLGFLTGIRQLFSFIG
jgi:hypothetical protein